MGLLLGCGSLTGYRPARHRRRIDMGIGARSASAGSYG
jgi:hypothetical protein